MPFLGTGVPGGGKRLMHVAALSLRRGDEVSMVFGDSASITRVPFNGGLAQFERTLDTALQREWTRPRNIDALLEYARRIRDKEALVVIATEEHALEERAFERHPHDCKDTSDGAHRCGHHQSV